MSFLPSVSCILVRTFFLSTVFIRFRRILLPQVHISYVFPPEPNHAVHLQVRFGLSYGPPSAPTHTRRQLHPSPEFSPFSAQPIRSRSRRSNADPHTQEAHNVGPLRCLLPRCSYHCFSQLRQNSHSMGRKHVEYQAHPQRPYALCHLRCLLPRCCDHCFSKQ